MPGRTPTVVKSSFPRPLHLGSCPWPGHTEHRLEWFHFECVTATLKQSRAGSALPSSPLFPWRVHSLALPGDRCVPHLLSLDPRVLWLHSQPITLFSTSQPTQRRPGEAAGAPQHVGAARPLSGSSHCPLRPWPCFSSLPLSPVFLLFFFYSKNPLYSLTVLFFFSFSLGPTPVSFSSPASVQNSSRQRPQLPPHCQVQCAPLCLLITQPASRVLPVTHSQSALIGF